MQTKATLRFYDTPVWMVIIKVTTTKAGKHGRQGTRVHQ